MAALKLWPLTSKSLSMASAVAADAIDSPEASMPAAAASAPGALLYCYSTSPAARERTGVKPVRYAVSGR